MKITIDTKEDSHDEIKKIVNMLNSLIEAELMGTETSEVLEDTTDTKPVVGEGIFGMFSDNKEEDGQSAEPETSAGSEVSGMLNENKEGNVDISEPNVVEGVKREDDGEPKIVPY